MMWSAARRMTSNPHCGRRELAPAWLTLGRCTSTADVGSPSGSCVREIAESVLRPNTRARHERSRFHHKAGNPETLRAELELDN